MRVSHVITRLIVGGAQENTLASVLGLRHYPNLEVELIAGPTSGPEGSLEAEARNIPGLLELVPDLVRPVRPWQDFRAYRTLLRHFRSSRPDVVHTHSGKAGILGRLAARAARVPIVVHSIHGPSFGAFQGAGANALFTAAERYVGRRTDHFVVVADAMARQYLAAGIGSPPQYTRIFSGFPLEPFLAVQRDPELARRLGLAPTDFVIGKIARLFQLKGHDELLAALPPLLQAHPQAKLLFVGDGADRQRLEAVAAQGPLRGRAVFVGLVAPAEVPRYIGLMDVLVHLSRREGLARALPQALAGGVPVVAYDCDGAAEVCLDGTTGYLVPLGDQEKLVRSLVELATAPALRQRLGAAGREFVRERFSVDRLVADQYRLYCELARSRGLAVAEGTASIRTPRAAAAKS